MKVFFVHLFAPIIAVCIVSNTALAQLESNDISLLAPKYTCSINLRNNEQNCSGPVEVLSLQNHQAVAKINLCSAVRDTVLNEAEFIISFGPKLSGWLINIGDSQSNNGYAGDWGEKSPTDPWKVGDEITGQSRDAEIQINSNIAGTEQGWSVWGSDHTDYTTAIDGFKRLFSAGSLGLSGGKARVIIRDSFVQYETIGNPSTLQSIQSPALFAFNGQPDFQGPVNCDAYIGINRVIDALYREGKGVESVMVTVYPTKDTLLTYNFMDDLQVLSQYKPEYVLPNSLAFRLDPMKNVSLYRALIERGVNPRSVNRELLGYDTKSKAMALETMRAEGLIRDQKDLEKNTFRRALRRFQRRSNLKPSILVSPEAMAELYISEMSGSLK